MDLRCYSFGCFSFRGDAKKDLPLPFGEFQVAVDSGDREGLGLAIWPADFDGVDLRFLSEAEVEAEVAARVIA